MTRDSLVYRIDSTDTIVSISDNWGSFANANGWCNILHPEDVVGHKLWDFIQDIETRYLYHEVFKRARRGARCGAIPFRCDSPTERRYCELLVTAFPDGGIQITSTILRTEPRSPVNLLDTNAQRSTPMVTVCSMCKKIRVSSQQWDEIEEGLTRLRLFEADRVPQLTHGLCPVCYEVAMLQLHEHETPNNTIDSDKG